MDPTYPLLPVLNVICFFLVILTSVTALKSWNTGVCMYAIWVSLYCLIRAVNSIIWKDNTRIVAPIWCDITTHFDVGFVVAIPACSLVITRRLYIAIQRRNIAILKAKRRFDNFIDYSLCLGLPLLSLSVFYYTVQGKRFQILEEVGCAGVQCGELVAVLLLDFPALLLPLISVIWYGGRIVYVYVSYRREVTALLDSDGGEWQSKYYRFMLLGCLDALLTLPMQTLELTLQVMGLRTSSSSIFWPGWDYIHNWDSIIQTTADEWKSYPKTYSAQVRWVEWRGIVFAVIFVALFGLSEGTRASCRRVFRVIAGPLGSRSRRKADAVISTLQFQTHTPDSSTLPEVIVGNEQTLMHPGPRKEKVRVNSDLLTVVV